MAMYMEIADATFVYNSSDLNKTIWTQMYSRHECSYCSNQLWYVKESHMLCNKMSKLLYTNGNKSKHILVKNL